MNINNLIIKTLSPFKIPCTYRKYSGKEKTYITFFVVNNYDDDFSDDKEETEVYSLQIDLFSKEDVTILKKQIKEALKGIFSEVTYQDLYEDDTKTYHIAFRCYFYEEKEWLYWQELKGLRIST